jgi:hypothetical protein
MVRSISSCTLSSNFQHDVKVVEKSLENPLKMPPYLAVSNKQLRVLLITDSGNPRSDKASSSPKYINWARHTSKSNSCSWNAASKSSKMFKLVALTVLLALSGANAFWTACPGVPAGVIAPRQITSPSCSGATCTVTRGQTLVANAYATFTQAHSTLNVRIQVFILGIGVNVPQDPPHDNACNSLFENGVQTGCPTRPGVEKVWVINMPVSQATPAVQNARVRCKYKLGWCDIIFCNNFLFSRTAWARSNGCLRRCHCHHPVNL